MLVSPIRLIPALVALTAAVVILPGCDRPDVEATASTVSKTVTSEAVKPAAVAPEVAKNETKSETKTEPKVEPAKPMELTKAESLTEKPVDQDAADRAQRAREALEARKKALANQTPIDPETFPVKVTPMVLDLGVIPTGDTGHGKIKLVNTGTEAVLLTQCKTSCGCTTTNCPNGRNLQPNEEVEVEVSLKGGQSPRKLSKKVTLIFNETQTMDVQVQGEAVAFVSIEPMTIDPEKQTDGRLVIRSTDGVAFHVTKMTPEVLAPEAFGKEALEEHVVYLDWEKWKELGSARRLNFYVDHPKTESVALNVSVPRTPPVDRSKLTDDQISLSDKSDAPLSIFAIERSIKQGKVDSIIEEIDAKKVDINETDRSGASLVALAAKYGNVEMIQALLKRGADVDATDKVGRTPLMTAAQMKHPEAVQALLDSGASLTPRDLVGSSALSWASGFGDAESVGLLIKAGSDLEVAGAPTGFTPLIWASGFGETASVKALIDAGANLEAEDMTHGLTPLMHAARTGGVANNAENIKVLVAAGAKLEAVDGTGKTPLLIACEASGATPEMIQALIDAGANLNAKDSRGQGAMDLAKKRTDPRGEAVRKLIESVTKSESTPK